jgi:hypothetical protein
VASAFAALLIDEGTAYLLQQFWDTLKWTPYLLLMG